MNKLNLKMFVAAAALTLSTQAIAEMKTDSSVVDAEKVHEVCMKLMDGQKMSYSFNSAKSMNFNIHYHEGDEVSFPVEEHLTDGASDVFTATGERGYCMMWTNPNADAVELTVEYEIQ